MDVIAGSGRLFEPLWWNPSAIGWLLPGFGGWIAVVVWWFRRPSWPMGVVLQFVFSHMILAGAFLQFVLQVRSASWLIAMGGQYDLMSAFEDFLRASNAALAGLAAYAATVVLSLALALHQVRVRKPAGVPEES